MQHLFFNFSKSLIFMFFSLVPVLKRRKIVRNSSFLLLETFRPLRGNWWFILFDTFRIETIVGAPKNERNFEAHQPFLKISEKKRFYRFKKSSAFSKTFHRTRRCRFRALRVPKECILRVLRSFFVLLILSEFPTSLLRTHSPRASPLCHLWIP